MRVLIVFLSVAFSCHVLATAGGQGRPIPPGIREADKQSNKPLEPPLTATSATDHARLKQEADELAQLSAGVPSDLARVSRGELPKDLADKLKRIEKLARHLRNELAP
jgi:hypothetical protein